jgi:hypothetical protein
MLMVVISLSSWFDIFSSRYVYYIGKFFQTVTTYPSTSYRIQFLPTEYWCW